MITLVLLLSGLTAVIALLLGLKFRKAFIVWGVLSAVLFQVVDYFNVGYLDSFWFIAFVMSFWICLPVGLTVSYFVYRMRRK